jgi:hypothetical protein
MGMDEKQRANCRQPRGNTLASDQRERRAACTPSHARGGSIPTQTVSTKRKSVHESGRIFVCIIHFSLFIIHYSLNENGFSNE